MALPSSGNPISLSQVNTELGNSSSASISMNSSSVRNLAGVTSGQISMSNLFGKSNELISGLYVDSGSWKYFTTTNGSSVTGSISGPSGTTTPLTAASDGNSTYVVKYTTGGGAQVQVSTNGGTTWSNVNLASSRLWNPIVYGNGYFVMTAGGGGSTYCTYSNNPSSSWTDSTMPATGFWNALTYTPLGFWAVNQNGLSTFSSTGATWSSTQTLSKPANSAVTDCLYANGVYMALTVNGAGGPVVLRSTDGTNFSQITVTGASNALQYLSYVGGNTWFATSAGTSSTIICRSTDNGASWSAITTGTGLEIYGTIITVGSTLMASWQSGTKIIVSTDNGSNWTGYSSNPANSGSVIYPIWNTKQSSRWRR
jgi:hypothetical protein